MKLRKPSYPDPAGSAAYYLIHANHRRTAIELAIEVLRDACGREVEASPDEAQFSTTACEWAIESLVQGAWLREFQQWEVATKSYFNGQHFRNGQAQPNWKRTPAGAVASSHVDKVKANLALFGASVPPDTLGVIDKTRTMVNAAKHQDEITVTEAEYQDLVAAVSRFWEALDPQEEFTPPVS